MTGEAGSGGKVATAEEWAAFLEARVKEELAAVDTLAAHGWWELTEPGARRFAVQAGGRVIAPVLTGSGHFADQATAQHSARYQPHRTWAPTPLPPVRPVPRPTTGEPVCEVCHRPLAEPLVRHGRHHCAEQNAAARHPASHPPPEEE
ncbi:hypothetical protein LXH09_35385 [Streptomyces sp. CS7]|uniref:hypothetical protein n=1 Tax=Streptomyces sp. CS-7 TaxID=2906769 RepID=UPI0021B34435|nr:hypothetical protein [Streptomyces sp. CS-7]MCT6781920.1 hypothetical protein [Streptomyces sp. CS-7]